MSVPSLPASSAPSMSEQPATPELPVTVPQENEVPEGEPSLAPAGRLRGDAADLLLNIALARIPSSEKDVLLVLYHGTYVTQNGTGWVCCTLRGLAKHFETWPSDIRERLNHLHKLGMIHRANMPKGARSLVCLRPVADWDPQVFDFAAARKRHSKPGAGAPPQVREPDSQVPVRERASDIRARVFMPRETVAAHVAARYRGTLDETALAAQLEDHWMVVERFQAVCDQAFPAKFLSQVSDLLGQHTAAAVVSELAGIMAMEKPPHAPWGYLMRVFERAEHVPAPKEESHEQVGQESERGRPAGVRRSRYADRASERASEPSAETAAGWASRYVDLDALSDEEFRARFGAPEPEPGPTTEPVADGLRPERERADSTAGRSGAGA